MASDEMRVFAPGDDVRAFDASTGQLLWTFSQPESSAFYYTEPSTGENLVFVCSPYSGVVYALDAATGAVRWKVPVQQPGWAFPAAVTSVTYHEGTVYALANRPYLANGAFAGTVLVALDAQTGEERWRHETGDATTRNLVGRGVSFHGDLVLYPDAYVGYVAAVSKTTHREVWRTSTGAVGRAPVVENGRAYVATDGYGYVTALDAATGRQLWRVAGEEAYSAQALCGPFVIASNSGADVFEKATGKKRGELIGGRRVLASAPVSDGQRLYLTADDGAYAFECR